MKHDDDRIIDFGAVKRNRKRRKKQIWALVALGVTAVLLLVGWAVVSQILAVVGSGDFWANFSA